MLNFDEGDIAILCNLVEAPEFNGEEVLVVHGLRYMETTSRVTGIATTEHFYGCKHTNGEVIWYRPRNLTRKPPTVEGNPDNVVVEWEQCIWQPRDLKIN